MIKTPDGTVGMIDLSDADADYALRIGESAVIKYSSATSVPLNIVTNDGVFEVVIQSMSSSSTAVPSELRPNNTQYPDVFRAPASVPGAANPDAFLLGSQTIRFASYMISTQLDSKILYGKSVGNSTGYAASDVTLTWDDYPATDWTSLGTVVFPVENTGKIIVRRIA